ncbi:MAG: hypothetical protein GY754_30085 [bacterium]|nr:hypothetical protein [bacterium]
MHLTIINASPRKKTGNTTIVVEAFCEGFNSINNNSTEIIYHNEIDTDEAAKKIFAESEAILLAFPLYTYGLTPSASRWVYRLHDFVGKDNSVKLGFLCQFGFREACHARALDRQLANLCKELGVENMGMIIRGGCEGIRHQPDALNRSVLNKFKAMGTTLGTRGHFDQEELNSFSAPEYSNSGLLTPLFSRIGIFVGNYLFWRPQLKKNGSLNKHWDRPLLD